MTKLKTMFGLCVMAALAVCAFAAQGASAQTAFECASAGGTGAGFKDAHCKEATASGAAFKHVALPAGANGITLTNLTTGGARSTGKLKSVQSGVTLELQSTEIEGTGTMENNVGGWAEGSGTILFKNVTVTLPAGKGCEVVGGSVTTNKLAGTTQGLTNELKFSPFTGTTFATFEIKGCSVTALNHVYTATGSVKGTTNGATTEFVHGQTTPTKTGTTGQETLKLFGQNAGLEGSVTITRTSTGNGIALT
jgi:hypothetical protein